MSQFDYQQIDEIIHSRIRLAILSVLLSVEQAEFNFLKEKVNATDGNLSIHLRKLEEVGYISVKKEFLNRKSHSLYRMTSAGHKAFEAYIKKIETLLKK